jgi:hypothetical protein
MTTTMTRERAIAILASELEASGALPWNAAKFIAELRAGNAGPGLEAALKAMQRACEECKTCSP